MEHHMKTKAFAELTGVSVRTLQYYDEIDLLKPALVNEQGHRFYDAGSFSQMFVILSLKNMGMSLADIHQYVNQRDFNIQVFIEAEKRRAEAELVHLQLRLLRLSRLQEQLSDKQEIMPTLLPLFSQLANDTALTPAQMENLTKPSDRQLGFNLVEWREFIENLTFCWEHKLTIRDKKAMACVRYWKERVLDAHHIHEDQVTLAEHYYRDHPDQAFGMTAETYAYLMKLMRDDEDAK
ncbi:MerR family transcriptional regulator [Paenibacillus sp. 598K]|uniref:MerR family transcriptional regulator n=1 Tax=Paenibacillus sp. 598K TaxID=1117987 RepID=UPI000FFA38B0|nr:MerR family transcriptional regulator [Paenibacillus sp. 598K]GBF75253.1 MerR family transcriptional regulator [Paenibacillus sp. 598K]